MIKRDKRGKFVKGFESPRKKEKILKVCGWCKKEYKVHSYRKDITKYCSRSCLGKDTISNKIKQAGKVQLSCKRCDTLFYRQPSLAKNKKLGNFCSRNCLGEYRSVNLIGEKATHWNGGKRIVKCNYCGKKVKRIFASIRKRKFGNYCSKGCWGEYQKILHQKEELNTPSRKGKEPWNKGRKPTDEEIKRLLSFTSPNKAEQKLDKLLQDNFPKEWKFVGNGKVIIDGKCPDFININGQKKIIELFGEYWHDETEVEPRKEIFANYGYETLIIWCKELKENMVLDKIKHFAIGEERA